ncbi:MAG: hypothetical protein OYG31_00840 [Candidatus Kaiserbacteria bacterium]|nr:hypothetical protein [Candidatus Kaiserbacteria bacterium]
MSIFGYIISFIRDRAFAHYIGAGELLDVYVASFRVPDLLFITATAFISLYALLPLFEEVEQKGRQVLQEFVNTTFYLLLIYLIISGTVLFFAIPVIGEYLFSGFSKEGFATFVLFSRMFLIQAIFFAIAGFFTALLQYRRRFFVYALLPILYNIGILIGVLVLYPSFGPIGLGIGVVLGALLNVTIQLPVILHHHILTAIEPSRRMLRYVRRTIAMSIPRAASFLSFGLAHLLIFSFIVSLSEGSLSIYYFAENLRAIPLVVVGLSYSIAAFPLLVSHFAKGDMGSFNRTVLRTIRHLFLFIFPLIAFVFTLREEIIGFFFETGRFTHEMTFITGTIVGAFIFGALTMSIISLCARALHACNRAWLSFAILFTHSVVEVGAVFLLVHYLYGSTILTFVQSATGLTGSGFGTLFAVVLIIVVTEVVTAVAIIAALVRATGQKARPILASFVQNTAIAVILAGFLFVVKSVFFSNISYASTEGLFSIQGLLSISALGVIGFGAWYFLLRQFNNAEGAEFRKKLHDSLRSLWN